MGIRFLCEACGKKLNVKDNLAGKKGRCPKCNEKIIIPNESTIEKSDDEKVAVGKSNPQSIAGGSESTLTSQSVLANPDTELNAQTTKREKRDLNSVASKSQGAVSETATSKPEKTKRHSNQATRSRDKASVQPKKETVNSATSPDSKPTEKSDSKKAKRDDLPPTDVPPPPPPTPTDTADGQSTATSAFNEAPDATWFVRPASGGQFGPADTEMMKSWLREGRIAKDSFVWREGWEDWQAANEVLEPEFNSVPAPTRQEASEASTNTKSSSNIAYHQRARKNAKTMGIVLIIALIFVTIALAILLVLVANGTIGGGSNSDNDDESTSITNSIDRFSEQI